VCECECVLGYVCEGVCAEKGLGWGDKAKPPDGRVGGEEDNEHWYLCENVNVVLGYVCGRGCVRVGVRRRGRGGVIKP
jgi:hypothetical protein